MTILRRRAGPARDCSPEIAMDYRVIEKNVCCPFCAESISVLLDLSVRNQSYIEDCHVCCQPMQISYESADGQCISLTVDCAS